MSKEIGDQPSREGATDRQLIRALQQGLPIADIRTGEQVGCGNCSGACCRAGMVISLRPEERAQMEEVGTQMEPYTDIPLRPGSSIKFFTLQSDCGNLGQKGECLIYAKRPVACRSFQEQSWGCLQVRQVAGFTHTVGTNENPPPQARPVEISPRTSKGK